MSLNGFLHSNKPLSQIPMRGLQRSFVTISCPLGTIFHLSPGAFASSVPTSTCQSSKVFLIPYHSPKPCPSIKSQRKGTSAVGPPWIIPNSSHFSDPLDQLLGRVNILGFEGHAVSVTTTHFCHQSTNCHQCYMNTWTWLCSHNRLIILVSFFKGDGFIYPISDECLLQVKYTTHMISFNSQNHHIKSYSSHFSVGETVAQRG